MCGWLICFWIASQCAMCTTLVHLRENRNCVDDGKLDTRYFLANLLWSNAAFFLCVLVLRIILFATTQQLNASIYRQLLILHHREDITLYIPLSFSISPLSCSPIPNYVNLFSFPLSREIDTAVRVKSADCTITPLSVTALQLPQKQLN